MDISALQVSNCYFGARVYIDVVLQFCIQVNCLAVCVLTSLHRVMVFHVTATSVF